METRFCRRLLVLFLLLLAEGAGPALAQGGERPVQRFATGEFLPYIDLRTAEGGFYPALIRRVLAEHGETVEFVERPWARAHAETAAGRFDGSFPYLRSPAREREFLFSDPLLAVPSYLFVRADRLPEDPARLVRILSRTCYLRDSLLPPPLQVRVERGELAVVRVDDMAQCFRMLAAGRIEAVPAGIYNGRATLRRMYGAGASIVPVGEALDNETLHLVWPRAKPESETRRRAFNASLAALRQRGEVAALEARLLPPR